MTNMNFDPVFDSVINHKYATFEIYLKEQKESYSPKLLTKAIKEVDAVLKKEVTYLGLVLYLWMKRTGDWGRSGEEQIKMAFCRHLLNLGVDETITFEHLMTFEKEMETLWDKNKLIGLSTEELLQKYTNFKFTFLTEKIPCNQTEKISHYLKFLGSKLQLIGHYFGKQMRYILCEAKVTKVGYHKIYWIRKELARTPNIIVAMAAFSMERDVYLREESFITIINQKWSYHLSHAESERFFIESSDERNISEGIKQKTLDYYDVQTQEEFKSIKKTFVKDMGDTIMYHELGHVVAQQDIMEREVITLAEGSKVFGQTVYVSFLEIMADLAPADDNKLKGPLQNMVDVSKTDKNRASRMFFMYFSDTWFYDTPDTYMYTYSDLITLILLRYLKNDGDIDFDKMEADLKYDINLSLSDQKDNTFLVKFFKLADVSLKAFRNMIQSTTFDLNGKEVDFSHMKKVVLHILREAKPKDETSYKFLSGYWTYFLQVYQKFAKNPNQIQDVMQAEENDLLKKIFVASAGKKKAIEYNFDHRRYIMDRMKELGVVLFKDT